MTFWVVAVPERPEGLLEISGQELVRGGNSFGTGGTTVGTTVTRRVSALAQTARSLLDAFDVAVNASSKRTPI